MPTVDYIYSAHSAYAYLGAQAFYDICAAQGYRIRHVPIALSPVVEAVGGQPFAARTQAHVDYFFGRQIERWAEYRNVAILKHRPTFHDNTLDLSNGVIIAAQEQGQNVDAISLALLRAHWRDDIDLADPEHVIRAITPVADDASALLDAAMSDDVQAIHAANTQAAIKSNVFGSPTYVVSGDMFYGQDHLDLVARAMARPFAPAAFTNPSVAD